MEVELFWPETVSVGHIIVESDAGHLRGLVGERNVLARHLEDRFPRLARCIERSGWPAAYIEVLEVTKEERGRGVGRALLEAALGRLGEAGVRYVFLHADADPGWQQELIWFYEGSGFKEMAGCQDEEVRPTVMRASLVRKPHRSKQR
jgi:GNAT superfamily N-acetyltransferase